MRFSTMQTSLSHGGKGARLAGWAGTVLAIALLVGCVPPADPESEAEAPSSPDQVEMMSPEMLPEQVSDRVLEQASADLNVPEQELTIRRVNQETWSDGCLGLGGPAESCILTLVPGWQVEVVYEEESYFYRTDSTGDRIRRSTQDNNLPPSIQEKVLSRAAEASGIPTSHLAVTESSPQLWDGCLGVAEPDTPCTQIAIYGWRAVVEGNGETLVYHTDMTGDDIRLNQL